MECIHPDFGENWGGLGNKKATASVGACRGLNAEKQIYSNLPIFCYYA